METSARLQRQDEGRTSPCLCVDLDGTLIQTDTLVELLVILLRTKPTSILRLFLRLFAGKARFKQELAREATLEPDSLPYALPVLDYIRSEASRGRRVLLVTGADESVANLVAQHLGLFSEVICSNGRENVTGKTKLAAIRRRLGDNEFSYAGNSRADLPVWKGAKSAVIVGSNAALRKAVERSGVEVEKVFQAPRLSMAAIFKAMRIYQWTKNALIFLPIMLSHRLFAPPVLANSVRAFLSFSLCASGIYLANDILDLPTDRKHARKRHRPLPSGRLSVPAAITLMAVLLAGAAALNPTREAGSLLFVYAASALAYSLYLKRLLMIDVIMLAVFYTLRVLYGGAATGITVSIWTLAFSMFMFLSLALIKRISELQSGVSDHGLTGSGRAYELHDLYQMSALSAASGCISALVIILYVYNPEVMTLYSRPKLLLGIFPLLIYWQSRLLILANRGVIQDDPIVFSLSDRSSRVTAIAVLLLVIGAL
jgi:4-hydroxybenzoate polyprenyltransferase/phosphoserine phosphatase